MPSNFRHASNGVMSNARVTNKGRACYGLGDAVW